jgi:hypothetical protein
VSERGREGEGRKSEGKSKGEVTKIDGQAETILLYYCIIPRTREKPNGTNETRNK